MQLRVQPIGEYPSDAALKLIQRKLQTVGTFMQTTAHPDDEDNVLLAMLGHGAGMRTVLVSATRGEGGQNEIGPELFEALSVLRTEEILAAHRFDGAEQFFTRAVDFGFSFSVEESIGKWGRDEIVGDYVRHIRATRPHVVAAFVCGGEGGGQAHQASTVLTRQAIRDAADSAKYPDQIREGLRPWRVMRLFCTEGFGSGTRNPQLLSVSGAELDPVIGRTYAEVGAQARSMHKCQGMLQLLPLPGATQGRFYRLLEPAETTARPPFTSMFDGIDTSLDSLAKLAGNATMAATLTRVAAAAAAGDFVNGLRVVRDLRLRLREAGLADEGRYEIDFRMAQKERQFEQAVVLSRGIRFEAMADDGVVAPGQRVRLTLTADSRGAAKGAVSASVKGFTTTGGCVSGPVPAAVYKCETEAVVPDVAFTSPYWSPRTDAARYDFAPGVPFGVPFAPSPFRATFEMVIDSEIVRIERPIEHRYGDIVAGEKRMELHVVPQYSVELSPAIAVIPATSGRGVSQSRAIRVSVTNSAKSAGSGTIRVHAPAGWAVTPQTSAVKFAREDEAVSVDFAVASPPGAAAREYLIEAGFVPDGARSESRSGFQVIEYPHIHRRHIVWPAKARLKIVDARITSGLRVGYLMGVGDQVPDAIRQLGATVNLIGPDELSAGDLSTYNVIVTGVRAYERRADLRANNHRLLAYAANGGTVLVQYNKFEFNEAQYGPYPATVSANRITDENAPVEVLHPSHPIFNVPNRIGPESWAGWVQERGLYFLGERDSRYVDLVRLVDPFPFNAGPKTGALVEAKVGRGRWVYIGLGLWRQLPAGTEGAYRLLANLLSLK